MRCGVATGYDLATGRSKVLPREETVPRESCSVESRRAQRARRHATPFVCNVRHGQVHRLEVNQRLAGGWGVTVRGHEASFGDEDWILELDTAGGYPIL